MRPNTGRKTLWAELLPYEFKQRMSECPAVFLPLGLCEPHGQISAFGLDTIKAEWLCREAARQVGGIVAPSMGYHIHETGYHARWLEEMIGEENPHMTSVPPAVYLELFLYQLRTFVNAGFTIIVVLSGHSGGNQQDLRCAAAVFMKYVPVQVWVRSDPELVEGLYEGDHAGKYEISQLMYVRPDLVDMTARAYESVSGAGGRLALGADAEEATPEFGEQIMEACLKKLCSEVSRMKQTAADVRIPVISYDLIETILEEIMQNATDWVTANPWADQDEVSPNSRWKPYERYRTS